MRERTGGVVEVEVVGPTYRGSHISFTPRNNNDNNSINIEGVQYPPLIDLVSSALIASAISSLARNTSSSEICYVVGTWVGERKHNTTGAKRKKRKRKRKKKNNNHFNTYLGHLRAHLVEDILHRMAASTSE